jgi:hypothetical protein
VPSIAAMADRAVTSSPSRVPPGISRFLNRTVLVSIPDVFDDRAVRPCKLRGVEAIGLWLQSEELTTRLLDDEVRDVADMEPIVLVPFAQVLGIVTPTLPPVRELPRAPEPQRRRRTTRQTPAGDEPTKTKPSQPKRSKRTSDARSRGTRGAE